MSFRTYTCYVHWIVENNIGTERIIGVIDVPGSSEDDDAYRTDLAGLHGIKKYIRTLEEIGEGGQRIQSKGV